MTPKDIERQKKLDGYQARHNEILAEKHELNKAVTKLMNKLSKVKKEQAAIGQAIYDLRNINGDTPHITDHAIVRYLERVKGLDIWEIKSEIMNHKDSVRIDNTIVTVNGEDDE